MGYRIRGAGWRRRKNERGLVLSSEGHVTRKTIKTTAYPEHVWEAWTEGDKLAAWLADKATGWPAPGSKISLTWDRFNVTLDYNITDIKTCDRLVWKTRLGNGFQTLTVNIRREGPMTVLELREADPAFSQKSDDSGSESAWQMSLAVFKLYVERYFGQSRSTFFAVSKASFTIPALMGAYATAKGLEQWLAESVEVWPDVHPTDPNKRFDPTAFAEALTGKPYRMRLEGGMIISGHIMTVTKQEVALSWDEINGFIELKCFSMGPGNQAVCLRGSGYGLSEEQAKQLEDLLKPRLYQLADSLSAGTPVPSPD